MTLYHWDLPQALQDNGGWFNRDTAARFADYAERVAGTLGDRVRMWITLNEPFIHTVFGHAFGLHAPGRALMFDALPTAHHQLLAHGLAVTVLRGHTTSPITLANNYSPVVILGCSTSSPTRYASPIPAPGCSSSSSGDRTDLALRHGRRGRTRLWVRHLPRRQRRAHHPGPADGQGRAKDLGIINIANSAPQVLAPALAAPVVAALGGYPVLYAMTAVATLLGCVFIYRVRSVP